MLVDALSIASWVFVQPWSWFTYLLRATGMTGVFLAGLSMILAYKFLIAPILGSGSSDRARKRDRRTEE